MPTFVQMANGSKTVFKCLSSALPKFVRVGGVVTTPLSSNATSVTFATAPRSGFSVEVMYGAISAVVDQSPGSVVTPPLSGGAGETYGGPLNVRGNYPLPTVFNSAQSIAPPVVNYLDDTAENVTFTLDPRAASVDVFGDGRVVTAIR